MEYRSNNSESNSDDNIHFNRHHPSYNSNSVRRRNDVGKPLIIMLCGTLVYYHCAYRNASLVALASDFLIVLVCSLAILGLLFRQLRISVPVDPLEWQISQETANNMVASFANTIGAAESVIRVAATGHDERLFCKVVVSLYVLSALGRLNLGMAVAYAGLCLFCLYMVAESSPTGSWLAWCLGRRDDGGVELD